MKLITPFGRAILMDSIVRIVKSGGHGGHGEVADLVRSWTSSGDRQVNMNSSGIISEDKQIIDTQKEYSKEMNAECLLCFNFVCQELIKDSEDQP